jgi:hypothetical protein
MVGCFFVFLLLVIAAGWITLRIMEAMSPAFWVTRHERHGAASMCRASARRSQIFKARNKTETDARFNLDEA